MVFICLVTNISYAQNIRVSGIIKDSIGSPLELANIIAMSKEHGNVESYAVSNNEGKYQLYLPNNANYVLKASFIGYETEQSLLVIGSEEKNIEKDIVLESKVNELDGVELVYEMPVSIKGDTIVYNADSFTTGRERKLADIIKKLPGLEVNEDGRIEVEGNEVSKVMIEGKDFFDGDSKLANENIPADAIDKIEVLRNYNEVDQMRGLGNDQNNYAINIKLKEGKKNFWFGEITVGGGLGDMDTARYRAHPKLFYYSPQYSLNLITDFNNIGEVPFTYRDYYNFTGGFRNFNANSGTGFNVSESDLGFAVAQDNRANSINTKFVAANLSFSPNKKWNISGFGIYSDNATGFIANSIREYVISDSEEINTNTSTQNNRLGMLKLSAAYKPNTNFQIDYDALIKLGSQKENGAAISETSTTGAIMQSNTINELKENSPFSINQNVNMYYTLSDKNIFAGKFQYLINKEDPFYRAIQDIIPFRGLFTIFPENGSALEFDPLQEQRRYNINQSRMVNTNKLDATVDYYKLLNKKSNINFTIGTTYSSQRFNSNIFQILDNTMANDFLDSKFNNEVVFDFSDVFLGVHYKFVAGKFTLTPGASLHNYRTSSEQLETVTKQNNWNLLPDANVIFNIKNSESLRFNYTMSAEYSDVINFAAGYVFSNYNRVFQGNRNLESAITQRFSLSYNSFSMFNFTNINASLNYMSKRNAIKGIGELSSINQISSVVNIASDFPDETFSANASFSKRYNEFQIAVRSRVQYGKYSNIFNDEITTSTSFAQDYNASMRSNFIKVPNIELGYRVALNKYDYGNGTTTYTTKRPYINVDINFLKNFSLIGEWTFYSYDDDDETTVLDNKYQFLGGSLFYQQKDSSWEFRIQGINLLDVATINNDSFTEQYSETSKYFVMPRILMLSVKYDL